MTRFWTSYWQKHLWRDEVNPEYAPVCATGSSVFGQRGVAAGDRVYIISISDGQLFLGGRMKVKRIVSRDEAVKALRNANLYGANEWALGEKKYGTPLDLRRRLAPALAHQLRFRSPKGEIKALAFVSDKHLAGQAARNVRELTPDSAALLDRIMDLTDVPLRSSSLITVTEAMLRNGLPDEPWEMKYL